MKRNWGEWVVVGLLGLALAVGLVSGGVIGVGRFLVGFAALWLLLVLLFAPFHALPWLWDRSGAPLLWHLRNRREMRWQREHPREWEAERERLIEGDEAE